MCLLSQTKTGFRLSFTSHSLSYHLFLSTLFINLGFARILLHQMFYTIFCVWYQFITLDIMHNKSVYFLAFNVSKCRYIGTYLAVYLFMTYKQYILFYMTYGYKINLYARN